MPALLTARCRPPKVSVAKATAASESCHFAVFCAKAAAVPPEAMISSTDNYFR